MTTRSRNSLLSFFLQIISLRPFRAEKHPKKKFDRAKGLEKRGEKEICVDRRERLSDEILSTRRSLLVLIDSKDEFHICRAIFIVVPVLDSRISPPRLASPRESSLLERIQFMSFPSLGSEEMGFYLMETVVRIAYGKSKITSISLRSILLIQIQNLFFRNSYANV